MFVTIQLKNPSQQGRVSEDPSFTAFAAEARRCEARWDWEGLMGCNSPSIPGCPKGLFFPLGKVILALSARSKPEADALRRGRDVPIALPRNPLS